MSEYTFSYWESELQPLTCDVAVIGAGIVGLSSALFVKRRNPALRVVVIERGTIPEGASTRNAGFACVGSITEHLVDIGRVGEEAVKKRIKKRYEGLNLLKETLGEEEIGYRPCGGTELFRSEASFREASGHIDKFNRWLNDLTGEAEVYTPGEMNGYPVIKNRLEGALNPGMMIRSLAEAARERGVEIRWLHQAEKLDDSGTITLKEHGTLKADRILVATNGFTRKLISDLKIHPARGYILLTGDLESLDWRGTYHHDRGYIYFRDIGDRLLLGGARNVDAERENTDRQGINKKIKRHLVSFAEEVLELPSGWKIDREWSGIMGFTETKNPIVKKWSDRIVVAAGLSGMGVAIGMKVAGQAVELLES